MKRWKDAAKYCRREYGVYVDNGEGFFVCPECGARMHGVGSLGKKKVNGQPGAPQYYYKCSNNRRRKGEYRCTNSKGIRQDKIDAMMANVIVRIASDEEFRKDIAARIGNSVDTSEYEEQIRKLTSQIRNKTKTLKRKSMAIDDFDWDMVNADAVYDALNEDYTRLSSEVVSLEKSLQEVEETLEGIKGQQITKDNVCRFILKFGKVYKKLSEIDKKKLVRELIESVELYPVEREYGSLIKSITFKFPLNKDKAKFDEEDINSCTTENHVETVVLLSNKFKEPKMYFDVGVEAKDYYRIKDRNKHK